VRRIAALILLLWACAHAGTIPVASAGTEPTAPTERPFRMGFTTTPGGPAGGKKLAPGPTIRFVRRNADFIAVHRDGPQVPWSDLAAGRTQRFSRMLARQRFRLGSGLPVFVLITPLNIVSSGISGDWPDSLGPACVSNPELQIAFKNYARVVVESMRPDYLALGAEVNGYALKPHDGCPDDFEAYITLYKETYALVKSMRPDLPVFVTFQLDFMHRAGQQMMPARFMPELDRLALSLYPSGDLTQFTPDQIPSDYVSWARVATPDLPLIVSETGYGTVAAGGAIGSTDLQEQYVRWLLNEAAVQRAELVTWFFSTDPRYVPPGFGVVDSFRSMGLATPRFQPKPALDVWRSFLNLPLVPDPS
jgi:hypothetical protein